VTTVFVTVCAAGLGVDGVGVAHAAKAVTVGVSTKVGFIAGGAVAVLLD
jgi:hypothetical protein